MKKALLTFVITLGIASQAWAYSSVAIAYSQWNGRWGVAQGWSPAEASQMALNYCGDYGCQVVGWVNNGCIALATGWNRGFGWAWNGNLWNAQSQALNNCFGYTGGSCQITAYGCSY